MKKYQFKTDFAQGIVDGILQGYKDYLAVRKEKKDELKISSAYAWVKGNHIDDAIARTVPDFGVTSNLSKAGYAWGYLQFKQDDHKIMFIIKNGMKHGNELPSNRKNNIENNYLSKLSQINKNADFDSHKQNKSPEQMSMSFDDFPIQDKDLEEDIENTASKYDRFFIVSYTLDENKMVASIDLLLPNPNDEMIYRVESWSKYIESSSVHIDNLELEPVKDEKEPLATNSSIYDFGIEDVAEEKDKE